MKENAPPPGEMEDVVEYYGSGRYDEAGRLFRGRGRLEFARTREILRRHLPPPPARVFDVGGASGAYTFLLAREGYEAHLLDPVAEHLARARRDSREAASPSLASILRGDGRALPWRDGSGDAALVLGPLYHLPSPADRRRVLDETHRVLRPGGRIAAAGINRFAPLLDGLFFGLIDDPYFREILDEDLRSGQHRNPRNHPAYFTTAVMHRPEELAEEVIGAGFSVREVVPVEGPAWLAGDFDDRWADEEKREALLALVGVVEREATLHGVSPHFLVIAQK